MLTMRTLTMLGVCALLGACGGGGGGGDSASIPDTTWQAGVFKASSSFQSQCQSPRSGNDPDGNPWPDVQGTAVDEKNWLRSWTHELYLWYDEVTDVDPATRTVSDYFDILKTTATTSSGQPKDKFHFTYDTDQWLALSQTGTAAGYGLQFAVLSTTPPRDIVVAYTEPGTPATSNTVVRGEKVLSVDGVDVDDDVQANIDTLNAGLFPAGAGQSHTFVLLESDGATTRSVTMTTQNVVSTPVQLAHVIDAGGAKVGYLLFNDHIATAEGELIEAIQQLKAAGPLDDLVLDIRYNGGGYLAIASETAYMIAGSATARKTFEQLQFNDQHPDTDPVTGQALTPMPFNSTTQGFSGPVAGTALPTLDLARVFILTGEGTCSASESIINSLRGIGVEVIQIGSTTCGKPYGFYPADNCGTTYFSIQFRGINNENFGDYPDGFSPQNSIGVKGVELPGCSVADDFDHALGDAAEGRLAEALQYRTSGQCSVPPSGTAPDRVQAQGYRSQAVHIIKPPFLQNRILQRPRPRP